MQRKDQRKLRADIDRARRDDVTAHGAREVATDREAQARAFARRRQISPDLDEGLEDGLELVGRNAAPGVAYVNAHDVAVRLGAQRDAAAALRAV